MIIWSCKNLTYLRPMTSANFPLITAPTIPPIVIMEPKTEYCKIEGWMCKDKLNDYCYLFLIIIIPCPIHCPQKDMHANSYVLWSKRNICGQGLLWQSFMIKRFFSWIYNNYKWEIPVEHLIYKALGACCLIRIAMNYEKLNTFYGPTLASNVQFLRSRGRKWKENQHMESNKND